MCRAGALFARVALSIGKSAADQEAVKIPTRLPRANRPHVLGLWSTALVRWPDCGQICGLGGCRPGTFLKQFGDSCEEQDIQSRHTLQQVTGHVADGLANCPMSHIIPHRCLLTIRCLDAAGWPRSALYLAFA